MTTRQVALAQRAARQDLVRQDLVRQDLVPQNSAPQNSTPQDSTPQNLAPDELVAPRLTWAELGCPTQIGLYHVGAGHGRAQVRVKKIHIIVAENDPAALFTVVTFRPPLGPPEHMLGHRVA